MELDRFTSLDTLLSEYPDIVEVFEWYDIDIEALDLDDEDPAIWELAVAHDIELDELLDDLLAFVEQQESLSDDSDDDWEEEDEDEDVETELDEDFEAAG